MSQHHDALKALNQLRDLTEDEGHNINANVRNTIENYFYNHPEAVAPSTEAEELAAQCWCDERTQHLVMDTDLANVFAETLMAVALGLKSV